MTYENFKAICERYKHTGETWADAWKHIDNVRVADANDLKIQDLLRKKSVWFTGNGDFPTGFIVLEYSSPVLNVTKAVKCESFISLDSVVALNFIDEHDEENIESHIAHHFPEAIPSISYSITFDHAVYNVVSTEPKISEDKAFKNVTYSIIDPVKVVAYYYTTAAARNAATYNNPGSGIKVGSIVPSPLLDAGTTYYVRAFAGNGYTDPISGTVTKVPQHADCQVNITMQ